MGKNKLEKWVSEYTLASKEATNGKLKEVFRGIDELAKYVAKVCCVVVHSIPPRGAFDINLRSKRIFYVWKNEVEIVVDSQVSKLKEDQKLAVGYVYPFVTVGNSSQSSSLIVEVSYRPYSEGAYKTIGKESVKHMPVVRSPQEIKDFFNGSLGQITVHNFDPYSFGGNHYHTNGKKEMFLVADGLVHVLERGVEVPSAGFEIEEILERIKSRDKDFAIYYDTFMTGGVFSFDTHDSGLRLSHATAAGRKGARFIELTNVAFDPGHYQDSTGVDILAPLDYIKRKKLLYKLSKSTDA